MADLGRLEYIAGELRSKASRFSNAAETLRQQATQLNWAASDLANGSWAGQGSQAFQNAWNLYHRDTHNAANALDRTAQTLTKLAQKIEEQVQRIHTAQAMASLSFLAGGGLLILDIVQLGLDPVTDAATAGAFGLDATASAEIASAGMELITADEEIAAELDGITNEIQNSSELGSLDENPGTPPEDINVPPEENGPGGGSGDGGGGNDNSDNQFSDASEFDDNIDQALEKASSDSNKEHHIFDNPTNDHHWDATGLNTEGNWNLIRTTLQNNEEVVSSTADGVPFTVQNNFGNYIVEVQMILINGAIRISDAWVILP